MSIRLPKKKRRKEVAKKEVPNQVEMESIEFEKELLIEETLTLEYASFQVHLHPNGRIVITTMKKQN